MTIEAAQAMALIVATIAMGLMAGVFGLYSNTIMRGLGATDDRTFVGAFGAIDRAIINPLFMLAFLGALVATGVAGALYIADDGGSVLPWVVVAFVLYLAVVVITIGINVPLNDALKAAGDPDQIADLATVRRDFNEPRWVAWTWCARSPPSSPSAAWPGGWSCTAGIPPRPRPTPRWRQRQPS